MQPADASSSSSGSASASQRPHPLPQGAPKSPAIAGFDLQGIIAESPAAIVYLATDMTLQLPVAIKEYMPQRLARREAASRVVPLSPAHAADFERGLRAFVDEARTLARCDHPSLLRVVRLLEANGTVYSVMPAYVGVTLAEVRRDMGAAPDEAWVRALLGHLLGALEVFHRTGLVHGDVTPGNILLLTDDRPVLLGPGAASGEIGSDRIEALMAYVKRPAGREGAIDGPDNGPWTDLRALAEVARFCITGRLSGQATSALDGTGDDETLSAWVQRSTHGSARSRYSASFLEALDAAASPLPDRRPQSVAQFREWLAYGTSALPVPPAEVPAREAPPQADPESLAEQARLRADLDRLNDPIGVEEDSQLIGDRRDAPASPAMPLFDPERGRRRRLRLWGACALGVVLVLVIAGAWVVDQQPVRVEGWRQGPAPGAAGPESAAGNSVAAAARPEALARPPDAVVQPAGADRKPPVAPSAESEAGSHAAAPNLLAGAGSSEMNVAAAAGDAAAAAPVAVSPRVASARAAAPTASPAAASVRAAPPPTRPARAAQRVARATAAREQSSPREACAGRTQFALYRCMQTQCGQARFSGHAQCKRLRTTDEVE
jgi:non-specific serine/threonine protein kinase